MNLSDEVNVLRQVPLLSCLDAGKLKRLAFSSQREHFDAGETLFRLGDDSDHAYILISGRADVLADGPEGEIKVAEIESGSIVGEIALLCGGSRTATVRASSPLDVLAIEPKHFLQVLSDDYSACIKMMRVLAQRLAQTTTDLVTTRAALARSGRSDTPRLPDLP